MVRMFLAVVVAAEKTTKVARTARADPVKAAINRAAALRTIRRMELAAKTVAKGARAADKAARVETVAMDPAVRWAETSVAARNKLHPTSAAIAVGKVAVKAGRAANRVNRVNRV